MMNIKLTNNILFALGALAVIIGAALKVMHYSPKQTSAIFLIAGHGLGLIAWILYFLQKRKENTKSNLLN